MLRLRFFGLTALGLAALAVGVARADAAKTTSRMFAGYQVTTGIKGASFTFVVPTITCKQNFSGVGPSVLIDSSVKNNRYTYSGGGVGVACQNHQPQYVALPIVDGTNYNDRNVAISPGDKVTLSVKYGGKTVVTLVNDTTKQVDKHTGKGSNGVVAYFGDNGVEINHKGVGLDPFTATSFSGATINGRPIGKDSPQRTDWVDNKGAVLVATSALSNKDAFTTTFKRSS